MKTTKKKSRKWSAGRKRAFAETIRKRNEKKMVDPEPLMSMSDVEYEAPIDEIEQLAKICKLMDAVPNRPAKSRIAQYLNLRYNAI